ncbi:MAG: hypothetical protein EXS58_17215 [Candidatus Latescibacteria bacterium]|nr:hypothetical protein [Candidatus Latescibacterota bacterium]
MALPAISACSGWARYWRGARWCRGGSCPSKSCSPEAVPTAARAELWVVRCAIAQAGGNISEAARLLNTNRNPIYRILDQEPPPPQP